MRFHAAIIIMRKLERRVAYGEAPSVGIKAKIHSADSKKRTPKSIDINATANDRRGDFLMPTRSKGTPIYVTAFISRVTSLITAFSGTIK